MTLSKVLSLFHLNKDLAKKNKMIPFLDEIRRYDELIIRSEIREIVMFRPGQPRKYYVVSVYRNLQRRISHVAYETGCTETFVRSILKEWRMP